MPLEKSGFCDEASVKIQIVSSLKNSSLVAILYTIHHHSFLYKYIEEIINLNFFNIIISDYNKN
nr:MAG TPA: hypothetical protein [Caudoviricetes sp.]